MITIKPTLLHFIRVDGFIEKLKFLGGGGGVYQSYPT